MIFPIFFAIKAKIISIHINCINIWCQVIQAVTFIPPTLEVTETFEKVTQKKKNTPKKVTLSQIFFRKKSQPKLRSSEILGSTAVGRPFWWVCWSFLANCDFGFGSFRWRRQGGGESFSEKFPSLKSIKALRRMSPSIQYFQTSANRRRQGETHMSFRPVACFGVKPTIKGTIGTMFRKDMGKLTQPSFLRGYSYTCKHL